MRAVVDHDHIHPCERPRRALSKRRGTAREIVGAVPRANDDAQGERASLIRHQIAGTAGRFASRHAPRPASLCWSRADVMVPLMAESHIPTLGAGQASGKLPNFII